MAIRIIIKVMPSAGKSECFLDKNGTLKCALKSAPEKGKANEELITLISKKTKVTQESISILLGKTSRTKTLSIKTSQTIEEFTTALCGEIQKKIS